MPFQTQFCRSLCLAVALSLGSLITWNKSATAQQTADILGPNLGSCQWYTNENDLLYTADAPEEVAITQDLFLTLEDTISCGFFGHRDLQQAAIRLLESQERWREARAAFVPDVSIGFSTGTNLLNANDFDFVVDSSLGLDYDVFTFGRREADLSAAEAGIRFAELEIGRVAEDIQLQLSLAYYDVQEADEIVRIATEAVSEAEKILNAAQGELAFARATVQLADNQQFLNNSLRLQATVRRNLATLLSLEEVETIGQVEPIKVLESWPYSLEESIILAYDNRAELEQVLVMREVDTHVRERILANLRPLVSVNFRYVRSINLRDFESSGTTRPSAALLFNWDPFDISGNVRTQAAAVRRNIELAEVDFAETRERIRFEVEASYFDLETRARNIEIANQVIEQAEIALELTRSQFGTGGVTQLDILEAQSALFVARNNLTAAVLGYNRSLAELKRAVGGQGLYVELPEFDPGELGLLEGLAPTYPGTEDTESDATEDTDSEATEETLPESEDTLAPLPDINDGTVPEIEDGALRPSVDEFESVEDGEADETVSELEASPVPPVVASDTLVPAISEAPPAITSETISAELTEEIEARSAAVETVEAPLIVDVFETSETSEGVESEENNGELASPLPYESTANALKTLVK